MKLASFVDHSTSSCPPRHGFRLLPWTWVDFLLVIVLICDSCTFAQATTVGLTEFFTTSTLHKLENITSDSDALQKKTTSAPTTGTSFFTTWFAILEVGHSVNVIISIGSSRKQVLHLLSCITQILY